MFVTGGQAGFRDTGAPAHGKLATMGSQAGRAPAAESPRLSLAQEPGS